MRIPAERAAVLSDQAGPLPDQLRLAVTAYLARYILAAFMASGT